MATDEFSDKTPTEVVVSDFERLGMLRFLTKMLRNEGRAKKLLKNLGEDPVFLGDYHHGSDSVRVFIECRDDKVYISTRTKPESCFVE